ncbi:unnamed protein product, partial [Trichogramma brassicae]
FESVAAATAAAAAATTAIYSYSTSFAYPVCINAGANLLYTFDVYIAFCSIIHAPTSTYVYIHVGSDDERKGELEYTNLPPLHPPSTWCAVQACTS